MPLSFASEAELEHLLPTLRSWRCGFCGRHATWVGHGWAYGYGTDGTPAEVRGRRILCTSRGRRTGCGRTRTVLLRAAVRGFVVRTALLWSLLLALASGQSVRAFWSTFEGTRQVSLTLRSAHRLAVRLRRQLPLLNPRLCRLVDAPASRCRDPIAALVAHLKLAFPGSDDAVAALQSTTQQGLFGAS